MMRDFVKKYRFSGPIILFLILSYAILRLGYVLNTLNEDLKEDNLRAEIEKMNFQEVIDAGYDKNDIVKNTIKHRSDFLTILEDRNYEVKSMKEKCGLDGEGYIFTRYIIEYSKNEAYYEIDISMNSQGFDSYSITGDIKYQGDYNKKIGVSILDIGFIFDYLQTDNLETHLKQYVHKMQKHEDDYSLEVDDQAKIYMNDYKLDNNERKFYYYIHNI